MTQDQIMELVQVYASAWALVGSRFDNGNGMADALEAKAEVVAAIEALTKDAGRYQFLKEAKALALKSDGSTWNRDNVPFVATHSMSAYRTHYGAYPSLDELVDAAITAQKEQV